jgi:RNA binding exosome subunit
MENKTIQFAKIIDGKLEISDVLMEGYKPLVYAEIPKEFDQQTQYVVQIAPIDGKDSINCGVEVREMIIDKEEDVLMAESLQEI